MYQLMTASYDEANKRCNNANQDKVFEYTILDDDFREIATGLCTNVWREYDVIYDFNWVRFTDVNTHRKHCVCQFKVRMKEVN